MWSHSGRKLRLELNGLVSLICSPMQVTAETIVSNILGPCAKYKVSRSIIHTWGPEGFLFF